jgi:pimeloyl-ACP methyl ester carboxylesterase
MATLYLIAGMGLDERCFSLLKPLLNWNGNMVFLPHLIPESSKEPLANYVRKLRNLLPDTWEEKPSFMGMSLGGIIAAELCKLVDYQQLFLISTLKQQSEIPFYFKILKNLPAHNLLAADFSQRYGRKLVSWFGGVQKEFIPIVFDMIESSDKRHLAWGRNTAINWVAPEIKPKNCFAIHGDKDTIFPHKKIKADFLVKNGSHNLILERAEEIAAVINQRLDNYLKNKD